MATIGPAPGVNIPWPDLLKELRSGRLPVRAFIQLTKDRGAAMSMAPLRRGGGGKGESGSVPPTPRLTHEERARRVLRKP